MATISVIVPVYKVENYIIRCVNSILAQSFTDFDLILIDDGSPDKCPKICETYAKQDMRIHVIHKHNAGLAAARNTGIEWALSNSDSQWITFIDSDDWIHYKTLELLYNATMAYHVDISICDFIRTEGDYLKDGKTPKDIFKIVDVDTFYLENTVNATVAWGKLYRKELFRFYRYPEGRLHEDEFITYKLLFKYEKIVFVNTGLYYYYKNPNSIMNTKWSIRRLDLIDAHMEQLDFFQKKGNTELISKTYKLYIDAIYYNLINVIKIEKDKCLKKKLKRKLKYSLIFQKKYHLITISSKPEYYDISFPIFMKFYWYYQAKIKRKK